jgi:hypothetical protein
MYSQASVTDAFARMEAYWQRMHKAQERQQKNWDHKELMVKRLLGCYGKPKIKDHLTNKVERDRMKSCEVEGCSSKAVRFVWVSYEEHACAGYMCLKHYRVAEAVIFCYS